jgi:hypothetical protein
MNNVVLAIWAATICYIAIFKPRFLLASAIICSVFEGAALLKVGGFFVSPYYFTLLAVGARSVFISTEGNHALGYTKRSRAITLGMLMFAGIAIAGAGLLPHIFAGWIVNSVRLDNGYSGPLAFSASNLGQSVYLALNVVFLWFIAQTANTPTVRTDATNAVLIAGAVVIGFAFYQFITALTGLPYPEEILFSNDSYTMQYGTSIMDMPRICSTFTEPAGMAVFMLGFFAFVTSDAPGGVRWPVVRWFLILGSVAVLILCTSSTAYLGLAAIGCWRIGTYMIVPMIKGTWNPKVIGALLVVVAALGLTIAFSESLQATIRDAVFEKNQSSSYDQRSDADALSTHLIFSTFGLGVGLGSNRASSFLASMLSTVGVLGAASLGAVLVLLVRKSDSSALVPERHLALSSGLLGILGAKIISSPDLSSPGMWAMMAALLTVHCVVKPRPVAVASNVAASQRFRPFGTVSSTRPI